MTVDFTNDEYQYLYTDKDFKLKCKEGTPDKIKKKLIPKIETFNKWIDEINGGGDQD